MGYRLAGGLCLMGFVVSSRAIAAEEQKAIENAIIDNIDVINASPNFAASTLFLIYSTSRNTIVNTINKQTEEVKEVLRPKFVEMDKLIRNLTVTINLVVCARAPFFDHFKTSEELGTIQKVMLLA